MGISNHETVVCPLFPSLRPVRPACRTAVLCGGNKRTQSADIDRAVGYWQDWQLRGDDENEKQIP